MAKEKTKRRQMKSADGQTIIVEKTDTDAGSVTADNGNQIKAQGAAPKREWYCTILYPDDPKHDAMLTYIKGYAVEYAYILHDRDVVTQHDIDSSEGEYTDVDLGKKKKPHWHIAWKHVSRVRLGTIRDLFSCWQSTKKLQACTDRVSYIWYWTHQDPKSIALGKVRYEWDEITVYGEALKRELSQVQFKQNSNFVQFSEMAKIGRMLAEANITTQWEAYSFLAENHIDTILTWTQLNTFVKDNQFHQRNTTTRQLEQADRVMTKLYAKTVEQDRILRELDNQTIEQAKASAHRKQLADERQERLDALIRKGEIKK